jgi:hypothetical protein
MSEPIDILLDSARRAAQRGELTRARAVVRSLTSQYPTSLKAWQVRVDLAEDNQERQQALEQVAILLPDPILPGDSSAARADSPLADSAIEAQQAYPTPLELTSPATVARVQRMRWPLYLIIGIAALLILGLVAWRLVLMQPNQQAGSLTSIPTLADPVASLIPTVPIEGAPAATSIPTAAVIPTSLPSPTSTATPGPTATPRPILPIGTVVQQGTWTITLLRPEDMLLLDGSIGTLQPKGRFALALVAVANGGALAETLPAGLISIVDAAGNRYEPALEASDAYLNTYGRGQVGDLSLREAIPPGAGNVSIPLIFDIPVGARDLYLVVSGDNKGWRLPGQ